MGRWISMITLANDICNVIVENDNEAKNYSPRRERGDDYVTICYWIGILWCRKIYFNFVISRLKLITMAALLFLVVICSYSGNCVSECLNNGNVNQYISYSKSSSLSSSSPPEKNAAPSFSCRAASHRFNSDKIPPSFDAWSSSGVAKGMDCCISVAEGVLGENNSACRKDELWSTWSLLLLFVVTWTRFKSPELAISFSFTVKTALSDRDVFWRSASVASWAAAKDCCKSTGSYLCNATRLHYSIKLEAVNINTIQKLLDAFKETW